MHNIKLIHLQRNHYICNFHLYLNINGSLFYMTLTDGSKLDHDQAYHDAFISISRFMNNSWNIIIHSLAIYKHVVRDFLDNMHLWIEQQSLPPSIEQLVCLAIQISDGE